MNAQEFLAKYPDTELHEDDHLTDLACPQCGDRDSLTIQATSQFDIYPDGTDQNGDVEWDSSSYCHCRQCGYSSVLANFTIKGLDEAIQEKEQPNP